MRNHNERMAAKELFKYKCGYCQNKFEVRLSYETQSIDANNNIIRARTPQVKCPKCGNFLPTFKVV